VTKRTDDEENARATRAAAIRACRRCDQSGWRLGPDGLAADTATRCDHAAAVPPPAGRDVTQPLHERTGADPCG